jgi:hypothetical protein
MRFAASLSAVGRRQYPPPPTHNERLCRDIGIEPPPKPPAWPWPGSIRGRDRDAVLARRLRHSMMRK